MRKPSRGVCETGAPGATTLIRPVVVLALAAALSVGGCRRPQTAEDEVPEGTLLLRGAGATFPSRLYEKWFDVYSERHPDVQIRYEAVGSGEGRDRFIRAGSAVEEKGAVDFGASDAALSEEEIRRVEEGARLIPLTAGGIVLAYNLPQAEGKLRLSRKAYSGIFLGEITHWDDEAIAQGNPDIELPHKSIFPVVRSDSSGTTFAFTNHLSAVSDDWNSRYGSVLLVDWPGKAMKARGNGGVAGLIRTSPGSIGYVQYGFALEAELTMAVLENRAGRFVVPSLESCHAALASAELDDSLPENLRFFLPDPKGAGSYPIVSFSWVLLYGQYDDAEKAAALKTVFKWCLFEGQRYAEDLGYVPLPEVVAKEAAAALETVKP